MSSQSQINTNHDRYVAPEEFQDNMQIAAATLEGKERENFLDSATKVLKGSASMEERSSVMTVFQRTVECKINEDFIIMMKPD